MVLEEIENGCVRSSVLKIGSYAVFRKPPHTAYMVCGRIYGFLFGFIYADFKIKIHINLYTKKVFIYD